MDTNALLAAAEVFAERTAALSHRAHTGLPLPTALTNLPRNVLTSVWRRLSVQEQARVAAVCAAWRAEAPSIGLLPLRAAVAKLTVAGDIRGGGTGREYAKNLLGVGTEAWNKWLHERTNSSWVELAFNAPQRVAGYGLCSANDFPVRDPWRWRLLGRAAPDTPWNLLHEVTTDEEGFTDDRWLWLIFTLAAPVLVTALRLEFVAVRRFLAGLQVGHLRVVCENL